MDNEKLYEDMKPKEKFEVLWAESGLADRPGAENLWQQMVDLGFFEKPASIKDVYKRQVPAGKGTVLW